MADASAARTRAVFEFKSATLPLIAVILKTADLGLLAEALDAQLADSPDFFDQEPVVIDLSQLEQSDAAAGLDFPALRALLARHQTQPIAVRGGSDAQNAAARAAGMSVPGRRRRRRRHPSRRSCARCRCRPTARC
jgi:septum site-determining protein MinC